MSYSSYRCGKHRRFNSLLTSTALLTVSLAWPASVAHAQSEPATDTSETSEAAQEGDARAELQTVIVRGVARQYLPDDQTSATGIPMRLVNTPQAITVLTPQLMDNIGADSVYEATDLIPGVQRGGVGYGIDRIMLRGLTGQPQRINGIEIETIGSPDAYAMQRSEVVRGPATALYGVTGAYGGEINSILKSPTDTFRAEVGAELGSFDTQRLFGDVSGPLTDDGKVKGRLVGKFDKFGPPVDLDNVDIDQFKYNVLGSLEWDISDRTTVSVSYNHIRRDIDPYDGGALFLGPDGKMRTPTVDPDKWYFSLPEQSEQYTDDDFFIAELIHELENGWTIQSKAAYQKWDSSISYFFPFGPFGAYDLADDEVYEYTYDYFTKGETFTYNASLGGDFELFGTNNSFYAAFEGDTNPSDTESTLLNSVFVGTLRADQGGDRVFADGSPWEPVDRSELGIRSQSLEKDTNLKGSVQVLLRPTDKLSILAGVLYHYNENETTATYTRGEPITPNNVDKSDWDKFVNRLGITYNFYSGGSIVNDATLYVNYSEGFQPQTITDADGNTTQAPRELEQYEGGIKAELFDGHAQAGLSVYTYEITNIAVSSAFLGSFGGFGTTVLNGKQKMDGVEAEITGEILPGWNIAANYTYMDGSIEDPNYDFTKQPRSVPEHSGALTTSYEFLEGPLDGLLIGTTVAYSSSYSMVGGLYNVDRFGPASSDGYTRVDLNASYELLDGKADLYANWHNVTDEDILYAKQGHPGYGITYTDQQAVTVGVKYRF